MVTGIIGRKVGMTQIFDADGTVHPATVIKAGPCVVVQAKTKQTDGYESIQLGFVEETPAKANKSAQIALPARRTEESGIGVTRHESFHVVGQGAREAVRCWYRETSTLLHHLPKFPRLPRASIAGRIQRCGADRYCKSPIFVNRFLPLPRQSHDCDCLLAAFLL